MRSIFFVLALMVSGTMVGQAGKAADKLIHSCAGCSNWTAAQRYDPICHKGDKKEFLSSGVKCVHLFRSKPAATPVAKHEEDCVIDRTYRGKVLCDNGTVIVDHRGDIEDAVLPQANNAPQLSVTTYAGLIEYKPMSNDDHRVEAFDFNSPGPIAWKDPYYVKYKSGWMCTRELVEKRDTICFRMLESFHWDWFDCEKDSQVCRDLK